MSQNVPGSRTNAIIYEKTEAILQGLQFVGEGNITPGIIAKVRGDLSARQRTALGKRLGDAPAWMHPALRQITRHDIDQQA